MTDARAHSIDQESHESLRIADYTFVSPPPPSLLTHWSRCIVNAVKIFQLKLYTDCIRLLYGVFSCNLHRYRRLILQGCQLPA
jgi:hypothetical protein